MMRLYHLDVLVGQIREPEVDSPWMYGRLEATDAIVQYRELFAFLTDEASGWKDPPFDPSYLEGWYIVDEEGRKLPIEPPAVHEDGVVAWRWG